MSAHPAAKIATAVKHIPTEDEKPAVKCRIHLIAIAVAGSVFYTLLHFHVGNEMVDAFAPLAPNVVQEILDMFKRL